MLSVSVDKVAFTIYTHNPQRTRSNRSTLTQTQMPKQEQTQIVLHNKSSTHTHIKLNVMNGNLCWKSLGVIG